jgi:hypothetical protein
MNKLEIEYELKMCFENPNGIKYFEIEWIDSIDDFELPLAEMWLKKKASNHTLVWWKIIKTSYEVLLESD